MSNELSSSQQRLNEDAIYYFKQACESPDIFTTRVKAFDGNGGSVFNDIVTIRVVDQHSWQEVPVLWEDSGISHEEYRSLGLYGMYSTTYNKMEFLQDDS